MNDRDSLTPDDLASLAHRLQGPGKEKRKRGLDLLLQEINSFPRLAIQGVEYKPLWLVSAPTESPNLRLVA